MYDYSEGLLGMKFFIGGVMKILPVLFAVFMIAGSSVVFANVDGVAGCSSIRVSPDLSLEDQQSICNAGENISGTSCAASGSGVCSSPKLDDTMPGADHCICVAEEETEAVAEAL